MGWDLTLKKAEDGRGGSMQKWPIFVISLRSATDRRDRSKAALEKLGLSFEFIDGVDGNALTRNEISAVYDEAGNHRDFKHQLSPPEIGCYLSHYTAWQKIAELSTPAIVLEDDFQISDDFSELLDYIQEFDLPRALIKLEGGERRAKNLRRLGATRFSLVHPYTSPPYTTGYLLSPAVAAQLAQHALPFTRPVDIDLKHWWEFETPILAIRPDAVSPRPDGALSSSISVARRRMKGARPVYRLWRNLRYQGRFFLSNLAARFRRPALWPDR